MFFCEIRTSHARSKRITCFRNFLLTTFFEITNVYLCCHKYLSIKWVYIRLDFKTLIVLDSTIIQMLLCFSFFLIQGRVAFGNKLLETTLCFKFECVAGIYTTSQANSSLDEFMHIVKCQGKNVRVILSPSPSYNGPTDE